MKKLILSAMILLLMSCEKTEIIVYENECLCTEVQEINVDVEFWTGRYWLYYTEWQESGITNDIEDCYTDEEANDIIRLVSDVERWVLSCENN